MTGAGDARIIGWQSADDQITVEDKGDEIHVICRGWLIELAADDAVKIAKAILCMTGEGHPA